MLQQLARCGLVLAARSGCTKADRRQCQPPYLHVADKEEESKTFLPLGRNFVYKALAANSVCFLCLITPAFPINCEHRCAGASFDLSVVGPYEIFCLVCVFCQDESDVVQLSAAPQ